MLFLGIVVGGLVSIAIGKTEKMPGLGILIFLFFTLPPLLILLVYSKSRERAKIKEKATALDNKIIELENRKQQLKTEIDQFHH